MKNKFILLLIIFTMIITFGLTAQNRIAVLPFTAGEGIDTYVAVRATDTFVSQLIKTSKDTIIGQNEVYRAVADFAFYAIKEFDDRTAAEIGKRLEADMVFVGNVTVGGKKKTDIHVRMVKTDTTDVTFSQTATVRKEKEYVAVSKWLAQNEYNGRNNLKNKSQSIGFVPAGGVAMAVTGGIITVAGIGVLGALMGIGHARQVEYYGSNYFNDLKAKHIDPWDILQIFGMGVGIPVTFIGVLVASLSAIPFVLTPHIRQGNPTSQISFSGGYDWTNREASFAFAIKL